MKVLLFSALNVVALANFSGCALMLNNGETVEIINASDYDLEIAVHGRPQTFKSPDGSETKLLAPARSHSVFLWRYNSPAETSISFKAWRRGKFFGAAAREVYVSSYMAGANTLIVRNEHFNRHHSWPW